MIIFKSINTLNNKVNFKAKVGFVPTMGALHKGHISLIKQAKNKCEKTLVSIFVNPSQFNKKSDYERYPKNIRKDLKILKKLKVHFVLIPSNKEIYEKKKQMKINIKNKDKILCAKFRPGNFEGVLGVISQFLKKINAEYMFLGEKDYQQIYLIKKYLMKNFKTKIFSCKTIREKNFAYSSRNELLSKKDIKKGIKISKILKKFYLNIKKDFTMIKKLKSIFKEITQLGAKIEYLEIRNKNNLSKNINKKNYKIFIAYFLKNVRLIDNF